LASCFVNSWRKSVYCAFFELAAMRGTRVSRSLWNWSLLVGLKRGKADRLMVLVGSLPSWSVTGFPAERLPPTLSPPKRSSACFRSASFSVFRSLCLFAASSSSLLSSSSSSACRRLKFSCLFSSIRCDFVLWFAFASASALAFASAAFFAFSRSTSESSAASHESRTYGIGLLWVALRVAITTYFLFLFIGKLAPPYDSGRWG